MHSVLHMWCGCRLHGCCKADSSAAACWCAVTGTAPAAWPGLRPCSTTALRMSVDSKQSTELGTMGSAGVADLLSKAPPGMATCSGQAARPPACPGMSSNADYARCRTAGGAAGTLEPGGWAGMRTVADLRRALGVGAPRDRDSLYAPIDRAPRHFNPLRIPKKLQARTLVLQ